MAYDIIEPEQNKGYDILEPEQGAGYDIIEPEQPTTRQPYGATRSFEAPPTETAVPSTTEVELPEPEPRALEQYAPVRAIQEQEPILAPPRGAEIGGEGAAKPGRKIPKKFTLAGAVATGLKESIPGVTQEDVIAQRYKKEFPGGVTAGQVAGSVGQMLAAGGVIGMIPKFQKLQVAARAITNPKVRKAAEMGLAAIQRGLAGGVTTGAQQAELVAQNKQTIKQALMNTAETSLANVVSVLPEGMLPMQGVASTAQLVAQPATDALFNYLWDKGVDREYAPEQTVRIAGVDVPKRYLWESLASAGFAVGDISGAPKVEAKAREGVSGRLGAKPEVKPEQEPRTKIRVGKKDTDTLTKLANTSRTKKYLDSIYANEKGRANHWFLSFDADKFKAINDVYGHPAGDQVLKQLGEITRRFFPEKFTGREGGEEFLVDLGESLTPGMEQRVKEFLNAVATEVKIEGQPVTISAGLAKGLDTTVGGEPRLLSDRMAYESKKVGRNTLTIDKDGEVSYTKGVETGEKGYLKPYLKTSTEEGINELYRLGAIDEDTYAQLQEGTRRIQTGEETSGRGVQPEVPPEARTEAKQEVTEPAKPEPTPEEQEVEASLSVKVDAGTPAETRPPEGPKAPDPPIKPDEDTPEFAETQQFANRSGGVFPKGQQQYKPPTLETEEARGATRFQEVMDKGRKEVKDKYGHPKYLTKGDLWASRLWDHLSPITRRLAKVPGGDKVVEVLRLLQGAQAESARVYRVAKKKIYDKLPHRYQDLFDDYLTAHRIIETQELKGEDFKQPGKITPEEAQAWLDNLKNNAPEQHKLIESLAQEYWGVWRDEVELKYNEGIIDKGLRDYLLEHHRHFNPRRFIQHLDPHVKGEGPGGGRQISTTQSGIKALEEGSEQALMSNSRLLLAEGIMRNRSIVFRNRANRALMAFIRENPDNPLGTKIEEPIRYTEKGEPVYGEVPHGMDRIWAFEGGERKAMLMPSELAQFYVTADPQTRQEIAPVLRVMSGAPMLRAMATGYNPGFAIGNIPRDLMHMWFVSDQYSPILPIAWGQQFADMKAVVGDVIKRKGIVDEYAEHGGAMDMLTSEGRAIRKRPWERRSEVGQMLSTMDEYLSWAGETSELWTRCALYRRARLNGKSKQEAAYVARNYIDFAQGGSWMKEANKVIPYLNAGIQGTRGVFRAYKDTPQLAVAKTAQITALGASLAYWNRSQNEEAWGEISEREKATGWIITTPWKYKDADGNMRHFYFKIAKDQAQQIFAMIGEELMEGRQTGKPNWQKIRMSMTELMPVDAGNILPPTVSSFLGYVTNKDFWLNDDIWKGRKDISPEEEYWNTTPEAWVVWGKATGMSPERSRRAFHKVFPKNVYTHLTESFVDELFGTLSDEEKLEISKPFIEKLKKMAESPVSRRIIRQTWPRSKKTEELLRDADEFGVDTHYDNGKTLSFFDLQRKVHDARIKQSDKRIQLDRRFDRLARLATLESEVAQKDFMRELNALKENNYDEYKRIVQRVKDRHPNVLNGRFIIEMKLEQPRGWEDRLEILQWFKNAKPEDKAKVAKKFPDLSSRMENITNNLIGGGNRRSQHEKFESRFRQLKKQLLEGDINKSEYDNKTEKLRADMKAFNRAVKKFGGGRK